LLELLRRLRQRVEFAGMDTARHEIGARALRRIGGQDRRLKLGKALLDHAPADRGDDRRAQHHLGVDVLPPQIEKAVGQPHVFRVFGVGVDREGQRLGHRLHLERVDDQLDLAGRQARVDRVLDALRDAPGHRHDAFKAQCLGSREQRRRHVDDALRDAVMVAQIDKQELAVIALPVHPAGETRALARIAQAQRAASMGAISVHQNGSGAGAKARRQRMDRRLLSRNAPR
jgi:hypothetical protein